MTTEEAEAKRLAALEFHKDMLCNCCQRGGVIGVASSSMGAISFAFCVPCLQQSAEPEVMFRYLYDEVSTEGEGIADWVKEMYTWKDGKYISWDEYVALRKSLPQTPDV